MSDYPQQVRFQMPSPSKLFTPAVTVILVLMVMSLLLTIFTGGFVIDLFGLSKQGLTRGMIWQIVTYSLVSPEPMQLVFNGLAVLFLGSMIERQWRTMSFIFLWVVVSGICGLAWILLTTLMGSGSVAVGANACIYGMLGTFGILFRRRRFFMFFATLETKYLIWILIAIGILMSLSQPVMLVWILGAPVGYGYTKLMWKIGSNRAKTASENTQNSRFADLD
ncbi:MAG: rhomboid family intramembrane serine protease [Phycisphaerae bacterium]|nr:rhomboid family intramembrane serine protease [Phycisphaerae bacterium]